MTEYRHPVSGFFAKSGQVVRVARTHSKQETAIAQDVIKEAVGDFKDIRTA